MEEFEDLLEYESESDEKNVIPTIQIIQEDQSNEEMEIDFKDDWNLLASYSKKINKNPNLIRKHKLNELPNSPAKQSKISNELKANEDPLLPPLLNDIIKLIFSFLGTVDFKSLFGCIQVCKRWKSFLQQANDVWKEVSYAHIQNSSILEKYSLKLSKIHESSRQFFWMQNFKDIIQEYDNSSWMQMKPDLYVFDIEGIREGLYNLFADNREATHSELINIVYRKCGRWSLSIPFTEYDDWTQPITLRRNWDERNKLGGSKNEIDSAIQLLKLRHQYFVELDKLFTSQEYGTVPTIDNLKKLVEIVSRHSRFHFDIKIFDKERCDSAWYSYVASAVVWFSEFLYFGELKDEIEEKIHMVTSTCFHSWASPSQLETLTGAQLLQIELINSLFQNQYGDE